MNVVMETLIQKVALSIKFLIYPTYNKHVWRNDAEQCIYQ